MGQTKKADTNLLRGFYNHFSVWLENLIVAKMVPHDGPGPFFRWLFKAPVLFYRVGLGHQIGTGMLGSNHAFIFM